MAQKDTWMSVCCTKMRAAFCQQFIESMWICSCTQIYKHRSLLHQVITLISLRLLLFFTNLKHPSDQLGLHLRWRHPCEENGNEWTSNPVNYSNTVNGNESGPKTYSRLQQFPIVHRLPASLGSLDRKPACTQLYWEDTKGSAAEGSWVLTPPLTWSFTGSWGSNFASLIGKFWTCGFLNMLHIDFPLWHQFGKFFSAM